jgi:tetratricopeptide (TPR) repeat protein
MPGSVREGVPAGVADLMRLGIAERRAGRRTEALACFERALAIDPAHRAARLEAAHLLRDAGRLAEAEAAYRAVLAEDAKQPQALVGLGRIARQRGDRPAALGWFEQAAAAAPRDPGPKGEAADVLRELGRLDEAEAGYRGALDLDARNRRSLMGLGWIARQRGDRAEARRCFEEAAAVDPKAAGAQLQLAAESRDLGEFDTARRIVEDVLARTPDEFKAWIALAQIERRAGRREAALAAFGRAVELNPGYAQGLAEMAAEERALGRPFAAERLLARALEVDPGNVAALLQQGDQARLSHDLPAALGWFERAIAAAPDHGGALLRASQALADLGRFDEAMAMLRSREAEHGPSPGAAEKQAHLLRKMGDWDGARAVLRRASAAAPRSFPLWAQQAQLERQAGNYAGLAEMLREPPAQNTPDLAVVQQLHGQLAEARWDFDEAIRHYEEAVRLNPNDGASHVSLARVRLLTLDLAECRQHLAAQARLDASRKLLQGRSSNLSQSHLGQLLDEFALDGDGLARIAAVRGLPPAERIGPLLALVRHAPDYTPAAISLLIALRQAGAFGAGAPPGGAASPIPSTIAQYWNTPDVPDELVRLRATWQEHNPGFDCRLFDDAAARAFLERDYSPEVRRAYDRAREPAKKADLFRLAHLFAEGGFYVDADDRCGAPLATVVPPRARLAVFQEEYGTLGNNFIGAVPGHPVIGTALDLAVEAIGRDDQDNLWLSTGPGLMTRAFAGTLARSSLHWRRWLDSTLVLERGELARAVRIHCACAYKQTNRHWTRTAFGRAAERVGKGERAEHAVSERTPARAS